MQPVLPAIDVPGVAAKLSDVPDLDAVPDVAPPAAVKLVTDTVDATVSTLDQLVAQLLAVLAR